MKTQIKKRKYYLKKRKIKKLLVKTKEIYQKKI